jgi:DNA ligase (NAD+)
MKKNIKKLKELLDHHNSLYYDHNDPEISDEEYDKIKQEYISAILEEKNGDLFGGEINLDIGYKANNKFQKIEHKQKMLSLDNAFTESDVIDFDTKVKRYLNIENIVNLEYSAELKIDGLSFSAIYKNGILDYVATRGDGKIGENITQNMITIQDFPTKIESSVEFLDIRGEIFMSKTTFHELVSEQKTANQKPFANPRNAASGSMRILDPEITRSRKLSYFTYQIAAIKLHNDIEKPKSHSDSINLLKKLGFKINENMLQKASIQDCIIFYNKIDKARSTIDFDIDGMVYKVDNLDLQARLGYTSSTPRWAIAHKFSGIEAISKINNIELQVGRLGNITPVANLEPVNIGGVIVSRATLHNFDEIERLDINQGDIVKIKRAGDVIPQIVEVVEKINEEKYQIPSQCPSCKSLLIQNIDEVALKCVNDKICKEQVIGRLVHFVSKDAFDINFFGAKQIERLFELGFIKTFADIFTIKNHSEELMMLDRMGEKSISNLLQAIENKRNISLDKFIYSISIKGCGSGASVILAKFFNNIENFKLSTSITKIHESIISIENLDGVGSKLAKDFMDYFTDEDNQANLENLYQYLNIEPFKKLHTGKFQDQKIIFTGTLSTMTRQEVKNRANELGFEVMSAVSKNLSFLVYGEDSGSKLKKANELGIKTLSENEWIDLIK